MSRPLEQGRLANGGPATVQFYTSTESGQCRLGRKSLNNMRESSAAESNSLALSSFSLVCVEATELLFSDGSTDHWLGTAAAAPPRRRAGGRSCRMGHTRTRPPALAG